MNESRIDKARIEAAVAEILAAIGEDLDRPGLQTTPARVAEACTDFFSGVGEDAEAHLADSIPVGEDTGDLVMLRDIQFRSMCEHHLLPFQGVAHIAYQPDKRVVGLGALPRLLASLAARPQVQERLTEQVANSLESALHPHGVFVLIEASHGCVTARGPRQLGSTTVTMAGRGRLGEPAQRAELIALIGGSE
ncbi:GTP cyclohydrolase I FolE [Klugiella xanthotipulae]|uniref:GTP cyclohydrolase 1 n=1 Tax=Klugiella xanthotipulae TaxID=244735 RepID=A0A543I5P1_9MICO|nr:GTP cyclohydrolase I [Klugiella xanthotipulae]TQM65884.1 GTP cyclohydrolase I [Klugiella xanthotipulae]